MVVIAAVDRHEAESVVVNECQKLATAFEEPIHIVHVLNQSQFQELEQTNLDETGQTIEIQAIREMAEKIADDIARDTIATDYAAIGLVGDPAEEIVRYATRENASYIVIGGRRRSKVGKALFGSVTQSILLSAESPVLTVMADNE